MLLAATETEIEPLVLFARQTKHRQPRETLVLLVANPKESLLLLPANQVWPVGASYVVLGQGRGGQTSCLQVTGSECLAAMLPNAPDPCDILSMLITDHPQGGNTNKFLQSQQVCHRPSVSPITEERQDSSSLVTSAKERDEDIAICSYATITQTHELQRDTILLLLF